MSCVRGVLLVLGLSIPVSGFAQFDRVDEILSRIEGRFVEAKGFPPTVENLKGFKPDEIRAYLLSPVEWEVEKLETREVLLKEVIEERLVRLDEFSRSIAGMNGELLEQGISNEQDLQAMARRKKQLELQSGELAAEMAALRDAAAQHSESRVARFEVEAAKLALEGELKKLALAESRVKETENLYKQGLIQQSSLQDRKAEVEELRTAVRLAELNVEQQRAEMEVVPGLSNELRKLTVMREQLKAQLAGMVADGGRLAELKGLLISVQRKEFESEMSVKRLAEMREELEQLGLEKKYLSRVLGKYEEALGKKGDSDNEAEKLEGEK